MVSDGYVKYEEPEVDKSAIMQDFRDYEEKKLKCKISAKFVIGYPCVRHYILFYLHGPAILHFF